MGSLLSSKPERGKDKKVLITGGATSYVGQFLVHRLTSADMGFPPMEIACTSTKPTKVPLGVQHFVMDFLKRQTVNDCIKEFLPDVIINLAAMTSPGACEKNASIVNNVNCPLVLVQALQTFCPKAKIIHMSTDHVYDGDHAPYSEGSSLSPTNLYGKSKRDFEDHLQNTLSDRCAILRSSVIYGPRSLQEVGKRTTFLQFVRESLEKDGSFIVFNDETRNFIAINNVVDVLVFFIFRFRAGVFNLGGPDALSRFDFARIVAKHKGLTEEEIGTKIQSMKRSECKASWAHACPQPKQLQMDTTKLYNIMKPFLRFQQVQEMLQPEKFTCHLTGTILFGD